MSKSIFGQSKYKSDGEDQWLSVSDLMAGLMIVFLFISIVLMRDAVIERDKIKEIAASYKENKVQIYNALMTEFENDLLVWDAEIDKKSLSFNFKSPEVLFDIGKSSLRNQFEVILNNFFPRYLKVMFEFKGSLEEVRIEGHTSSLWSGSMSEDEAYFKNMELSQSRTRAVLSYIYNIDDIRQDRAWIKSNIAAVGYSSSKLIVKNGIEDNNRSRRVTFRLITNSEIQIMKIIGN